MGGVGVDRRPVRGRSALRLETINIDCADADAMAAFCGRLLGWQIAHRDGDFIVLRDPGGDTGLSFREVAGNRPPVWPEEPGGQGKMLHLDIRVDELEATVAHALACGARLAAYQGRVDLRVLLDPAGHPFCLFTV